MSLLQRQYGLRLCLKHHQTLSSVREINVKAQVTERLIQQRVALTGRSRTGPPGSVGCLTAHAPDLAVADCPHALRPARPPASSITDDDNDR